jgi:esterase FrsA
VFIFGFGLANSACAQEQSERTLDEIKTEAIKRAENGMYPLIGLNPANVREAFAAIATSGLADSPAWGNRLYGLMAAFWPTGQ